MPPWAQMVVGAACVASPSPPYRRGGLRNTEIPPPTAHYTRKPHANPLRFLHNDAARRVATVFETCNFLIETDLCARRENLPRKIEPLRAFRRGSPFGIRRFKSILPFLGGRSDAARRVVILPFAVPVDAHVGANDGRCRIRRIPRPAMPPVGRVSIKGEERIVAAFSFPHKKPSAHSASSVDLHQISP